MLESPINRNPSRPPWLPVYLLRANNMPRAIEPVEILPRENVPVAVEKCALQIRRQSAQRLQIILIARVNRIVRYARRNEIVIRCVEFFGMFHAGRGLFIDPQRLHPGMTDVSGVGSTSHARKRARHGTPIA